MVVVRTLAAGALTTNWLVGGIKPSQDSLRAGTLPPGAIVGRNSYGTVGYRLGAGSAEPGLVVIGIYAFEKRGPLHTGFGQDALAEALGSLTYAWGSTTVRVGGRRGASILG